jgi:type VI protein secretion system component Hcp
MLVTAGLALTGAAPAGAESFTLTFSKIKYTYKQQSETGSDQPAQGATATGKAS